MRLTLEALQVLDAIDRKGSFAAAAETLHRVPSALTYTVQKLEQDLDVALFDRSGHRARLTEAGSELLREGRHLLEAAAALENRIRRIATGWESELRIAVGDILQEQAVLALIAAFDEAGGNCRLRLLREVLGGVWDAVISGRADLAIGAPGERPGHPGLKVQPLGEVAFTFAVSPRHPILAEPQPITAGQLRQHRMVVASDSSRTLSPRSAGLLDGQNQLAVPDMATKIDAQRMGLGVGFLPRNQITRWLQQGALIEMTVEEPKPPARLFTVWDHRSEGKALAWFIEQLAQPGWQQRLCGAST
jgi:DNA-binding transcriptional LysR family regulator